MKPEVTNIDLVSVDIGYFGLHPVIHPRFIIGKQYR